MLCYAMLCYAMLCHAILSNTSLPLWNSSLTHKHTNTQTHPPHPPHRLLMAINQSTNHPLTSPCAISDHADPFFPALIIHYAAPSGRLHAWLQEACARSGQRTNGLPSMVFDGWCVAGGCMDGWKDGMEWISYTNMHVFLYFSSCA